MNEVQLEDSINTSGLINDASFYVKELFKKDLPKQFYFHNFTLTKEIAATCLELTKSITIDEEDRIALQLTALFHLSGYTRKNDENYITESQNIAEKFLKEHHCNAEQINKVSTLIASTHPDHTPQNLLEEILHDARYAFAGEKKFFKQAELLRLELEHLHNRKYEEEDWQQYLLSYLANINYFTEPAKNNFEKRRLKNIQTQRNYELKAHKLTTREKTGKDFGRGVDTLYRANYRNHINLSAIADGKANMMISINTIVVSVIVTLSGASLSLSEAFIVEHMRFVLPILFLLVGALTSVVFAILSAKPAVTSGTNSTDDKGIQNSKTSLLYFGNFLNIPLEAFVEHLNELKQNQQKLYDSMSIDLYNLGKVLKRKYKLLSVSYNVFMVALILSVTSFILIFFISNTG